MTTYSLPVTIRSDSSDLISQTDLAVDTSDATDNFTTALEVGGFSRCVIQAVAASGTHTTHVLTVQISTDGTNYVSTSTTLAQLGVAEFTVNARYVRASVTTPEAVASTTDVTIQAKP